MINFVRFSEFSSKRQEARCNGPSSLKGTIEGAILLFCLFADSWLTILQVFLEGVKGALTADSLFQDGWYEKIPTKGFRAAARVYSGWGFSQTFYWNEVRILNQLMNGGISFC